MATLDEDLALLLHFLGLLLAHRAAQQVGAAERVARQHVGGLHHLLLIHEHAERFLENRFEQRMIVLNLHLAVLAVDVVVEHVHRPGSEQRDERDDVLDGTDLELAAQVAHPAGFQLEHADGVRLVQQVERLRVVERNLVDVEALAGGLFDEIERVLDDRQRLQPEEVHLQQAEVAQRIHRVLRDDFVRVRAGGERHNIRERLRADDHAGRVRRRRCGQCLRE